MPVREKVEWKILCWLGGGYWNWSNPEEAHVSSGGDTADDEQYDAMKAFAADLWVELLSEIDWSRVQLEASSRHLSLGHPPIMFSDEIEAPCGECIHQALLVRERFVNDWAEVEHPDNWREINNARRERLREKFQMIRPVFGERKKVK